MASAGPVGFTAVGAFFVVSNVSNEAAVPLRQGHCVDPRRVARLMQIRPRCARTRAGSRLTPSAAAARAHNRSRACTCARGATPCTLRCPCRGAGRRGGAVACAGSLSAPPARAGVGAGRRLRRHHLLRRDADGRRARGRAGRRTRVGVAAAHDGYRASRGALQRLHGARRRCWQCARARGTLA